MKHILIAAAAVVACGTPALAETHEAVAGPYVQISGGVGVAGRTKVEARVSGLGSASDHANLKIGAFGAIAGGVSLENGFALEAELMHFQNDIKSGAADALLGVPLDASVKTTGVMANAIYEIAPAGPVSFSVGAGLGYGRATYELLGVSDKEYGVMWQLMGGVSMPVSPKVSLETKYRYIQGPKYSESVVIAPDVYSAEAKTATHAVTVGARFKF